MSQKSLPELENNHKWTQSRQKQKKLSSKFHESELEKPQKSDWAIGSPKHCARAHQIPNEPLLKKMSPRHLTNRPILFLFDEPLDSWLKNALQIDSVEHTKVLIS